MEQELFSVLSNDAGVSALVGTRIYPRPAPDDVLRPYVIYTLIYSEHFGTIDSVSTIQQGRFQLDCIAESYSEAKAIAAAVKSAVDGYSGSTLRSVRKVSNADMYDEDAKLHRVMVEVAAWADEG